MFNGVRICEVNGDRLGLVMYDAKTPYGWACMGPRAFMELGCSLGVGKGQQYAREAVGKPWRKIAG